MTEHHHKAVEESVPVEPTVVDASKSSEPVNLTALSVLVGSLLLCATIFYNTGVLDKKIQGLADNIKQVNLAGAVINNPGQGSAVPNAPTGPVEVAVRDNAPVIGKADAKVTICEFSDFQCPFCQRFYKDTYPQLKAKYIDTGKVKMVYRHYPLPFHQNAEKSAIASECAREQGKFEAYHNMLFERGQSDGIGLNDADLKKYADELGLNNGTLGLSKNKFNQCFDSKQTQSLVSQDMQAAGAAGVTGTPTFFINGTMLVGAQPLSSFEQIIEAELNE